MASELGNVPTPIRWPETGLDVAWSQSFGSGELQFTWEACRDYGLDPTDKVRPSAVPRTIGSHLLQNNLPASSLMVVGPAELHDAAELMFEDPEEAVGEDSTWVVGLKPVQVITLISLKATMHDTNDIQADAIATTYEDEWQPVWADLLKTETGWNYLASHMLADIARQATRFGLLAHQREYPPRGGIRRPVISRLANLQGELMAQSVHQTFCDKSHYAGNGGTNA